MRYVGTDSNATLVEGYCKIMERRQFLFLSSLAATQHVLPRATSAAPIQAEAKPDLTQWVNVFLGTGGHGHTFPGATVPLGAVQLSPDTGIRDWDWSSGYDHDDQSLTGFSHTHLSGTGVGDMMDLLLVPRTGTVILERGRLRKHERTLGARTAPSSRMRMRRASLDTTAC